MREFDLDVSLNVADGFRADDSAGRFAIGLQVFYDQNLAGEDSFGQPNDCTICEHDHRLGLLDEGHGRLLDAADGGHRPRALDADWNLRAHRRRAISIRTG